MRSSAAPLHLQRVLPLKTKGSSLANHNGTLDVVFLAVQLPSFDVKSPRGWQNNAM